MEDIRPGGFPFLRLTVYQKVIPVFDLRDQGPVLFIRKVRSYPYQGIAFPGLYPVDKRLYGIIQGKWRPVPSIPYLIGNIGSGAVKA